MPISVKCKLLLYADDSALLVSGKDPQDIANVLTLELESCSKWQTQLLRAPLSQFITGSDVGQPVEHNGSTSESQGKNVGMACHSRQVYSLRTMSDGQSPVLKRKSVLSCAVGTQSKTHFSCVNKESSFDVSLLASPIIGHRKLNIIQKQLNFKKNDLDEENKNICKVKSHKRSVLLSPLSERSNNINSRKRTNGLEVQHKITGIPEKMSKRGNRVCDKENSILTNEKDLPLKKSKRIKKEISPVGQLRQTDGTKQVSKKNLPLEQASNLNEYVCAMVETTSGRRSNLKPRGGISYQESLMKGIGRIRNKNNLVTSKENAEKSNGKNHLLSKVSTKGGIVKSKFSKASSKSSVNPAVSQASSKLAITPENSRASRSSVRSTAVSRTSSESAITPEDSQSSRSSARSTAVSRTSSESAITPEDSQSSRSSARSTAVAQASSKSALTPEDSRASRSSVRSTAVSRTSSESAITPEDSRASRSSVRSTAVARTSSESAITPEDSRASRSSARSTAVAQASSKSALTPKDSRASRSSVRSTAVSRTSSESAITPEDSRASRSSVRSTAVAQASSKSALTPKDSRALRSSARSTAVSCAFCLGVSPTSSQSPAHQVTYSTKSLAQTSTRFRNEKVSHGEQQKKLPVWAMDSKPNSGKRRSIRVKSKDIFDFVCDPLDEIVKKRRVAKPRGQKRVRTHKPKLKLTLLTTDPDKEITFPSENQIPISTNTTRRETESATSSMCNVREDSDSAGTARREIESAAPSVCSARVDGDLAGTARRETESAASSVCSPRENDELSGNDISDDEFARECVTSEDNCNDFYSHETESVTKEYDFETTSSFVPTKLISSKSIPMSSVSVFPTPAISKHISKYIGGSSTPRVENAKASDSCVDLIDEQATNIAKEDIVTCFGFDEMECELEGSELDLSPVRCSGQLQSCLEVTGTSDVYNECHPSSQPSRFSWGFLRPGNRSNISASRSSSVLAVHGLSSSLPSFLSSIRSQKSMVSNANLGKSVQRKKLKETDHSSEVGEGKNKTVAHPATCRNQDTGIEDVNTSIFVEEKDADKQQKGNQAKLNNVDKIVQRKVLKEKNNSLQVEVRKSQRTKKNPQAAMCENEDSEKDTNVSLLFDEDDVENLEKENVENMSCLPGNGCSPKRIHHKPMDDELNSPEKSFLKPPRKSYNRSCLEECRRKFIREYAGGTTTDTEDDGKERSKKKRKKFKAKTSLKKKKGTASSSHSLEDSSLSSESLSGKSCNTLKNKRNKVYEQSMNEWIASTNSFFEEVENSDLIIEDDKQ
ncbi:platelet binding protein GspB isoform X2 [Cherax quadricarinatus]|uniref:platelet binding protein GspB isoform X2 n=1 Tax=Cherax quadricarinatus TaxID=27406 RepID=UPI00387E3C02